MALLWMDGFDHYSNTETFMLDGLYAQASGILSSSPVRTGLRSLLIDQGTILRKVLPSGRAAVGVGMGLYFPQIPSINNNAVLIDFRDNTNTRHVAVGVTSTGALEVFSGVSYLGTTAPVLTANAWHHLEMAVGFSNTVGTVEIRVNGVTVLSLTGQDTVSTANVQCAQVASFNTAGSPTSNFYIDDLFIWDTLGSHNNDFIGDRRVLRLLPNADTAETDWVRNTGSNDFEAIDEVPPDDDATYVEATAATDRSEYGMENLGAEVVNVAALMTLPRIKKTDAGTANAQISLVSGASVTAGADRPITTAYTYWPDVFETDPATGAPWTPSAVNSALVRIERTA